MYLQDVSQAVVPYWRRDNLRNSIKSLKKSLDDLDKAKKAAILSEVQFKCIILF